MEQDGFQALASDAASADRRARGAGPAWAIDLAAVVIAVVAALACRAILISMPLRTGAIAER
jgi:hypothetical protein